MKRFLRMIITVCVLACALTMSIFVYAAEDKPQLVENVKTDKKTGKKSKTYEAVGKAKNKKISLSKVNAKNVLYKNNQKDGYLVIEKNDKKTISASSYQGPIINRGIITITGGDFKGTIINDNILIIKGGKFLKKGVSKIENSTGKQLGGLNEGLNIINRKGATIKIAGGTLECGILNYGTTKITGGTFKGRIWNYGKDMKIAGGKLTSGVWNYGTTKILKKAVKIDVEGQDTIVNGKNGILYIFGGTFKNKYSQEKRTYLIQNFGRMEIGKNNADEEIKCTGLIYNYNYLKIRYGKYTDSSGRVLLRNDGRMVIEDGEFKSNAHVIYNTSVKGLKITGGTYTATAKNGIRFAIYNDGGTLDLRKGIFKTSSQDTKYSIGSTNDNGIRIDEPVEVKAPDYATRKYVMVL